MQYGVYILPRGYQGGHRDRGVRGCVDRCVKL